MKPFKEVFIMNKDHQNTPNTDNSTELEQLSKKKIRKPWKTPEIIEEDYSRTEMQLPPTLPGSPDQAS